MKNQGLCVKVHGNDNLPMDEKLYSYAEAENIGGVFIPNDHTNTRIVFCRATMQENCVALYLYIEGGNVAYSRLEKASSMWGDGSYKYKKTNELVTIALSNNKDLIE